MLTIFAKTLTTDFWLRSRSASETIAQHLFRTHSNIYDGAFLQKQLTAKNPSLFLQKILHHIDFWLDFSIHLLAILSNRHLKDIILWNKSKKVLQNKMKDLTFEVSHLSISFFFLKSYPMRDQTFMTPTQKGEKLKFVKCLQIL